MLSLLVGCDFKPSSQPSVLVVAVEGLDFDSISCEPEDEHSFEAMRPFCDEAVRFSHAYTPSTLTQATMASVLTGLYPFDHGVHNNGADFLSARFHTASEEALSKRYRTLFVSGGAPIWRKSGLAQGFEVFDDTMEISPGHYYRPAEDVVQIATSWIDHESRRSPFFAVLYMNDLEFPQIATKDSAGEPRERTVEGQVGEVTDGLARLVTWLKKNKRWNSTNVVLLGTNGISSRENDTEPPPLNLKSNATQVALFIKPAHRETDNAIQWAVDRPVSLVDVGRTLFDWVKGEAPHSSVSELEPQSLAETVLKVQSGVPEPSDRLLLSETGWPTWIEGDNGKTSIRYAVRKNRFLFIDDLQPKIFNTLTDHMEVLPLKRSDPLWTTYNGDILALLAKMKIEPWPGMQTPRLEEIQVAQELWRTKSAERVALKEPWSKWYLNRALRKHDWPEVRRLSEARADSLGVFVARRNSGETVGVPPMPCLRLALNVHNEHKNYQTECGDDLTLALHAWQSSRADDERVLAQDRFLKMYSLHLLDQQIGRLNYLNDLRFDADPENPRGPRMVDYILSLKELEPFAKKVDSALGGKDLTL